MPFVQLTTGLPVSRDLAGRLAACFCDALGLAEGDVIVQHVPAAAGPGAVAVVVGRPRPAEAMRESVSRAGALLAEGLELDPDLVFVTWPEPCVSATGRGALT
ncbi:hypothetical protein E1292_36415 [Nonomuraea deserti]|uniref:Uncharacterized protein n=1 Tax=Nonomuraea deserti TaxID=1848322 RepID=A0A4R4VDU5_9ACTN|nr:hypothetical protein [Nonomuraea deserti]TDC97779.1 hypothetical protein E1292_36415 [Nonomuraea deserti]